MNNPHEVRTVRCANCGELRTEQNHWFLTSIEGGRFQCVPLSAGMNSILRKSSMPSGRRLKGAEQPACGQQCAQKLFERYLAQRRG